MRIISPRRRFSKNNGCARFLPQSRFEERKICEYMINLINSKFLNHKPFELFSLSIEILGANKLAPLLNKMQPAIVIDKKCAVNKLHDDIFIEEDDIEKYKKIPRRAISRLLKESILPMLNKRMQQFSSSNRDGVQRRLHSIKDTFKLTDEDADILLFYYLLNTSELLSGYLEISQFSNRSGDNVLTNFSSFMTLRNHGHIVFGFTHRSFIRALSNGSLFTMQLLSLDEGDNSIEISDWTKKYLMGAGKQKIEHEFFTNENNTLLDISDFDLASDDLLVLKSLLKDKGKCNILFYGKPGTGKTSLTQTLTKAFGKDLLSIRMSEEDRETDRLRAIYATINIAGTNSSIILVDEADGILNGGISKGLLNNLIDKSTKKIIWITNRTVRIDKSIMRRFSFSMEFKALTSQRRLAVLKYELKKKGLESFFTDRELSDLSKNYAVDAGSIANAMNMLRPTKIQKKETVIRKIRTVLASCEKVLTGKKADKTKRKVFEQYSLEGLNTSQNLYEIINNLRQYCEVYEKDDAAPSMALLVYGLPGTGKSEFVHYLGNCLGKEVVLKRCSEIQSMWVGETEKNIESAFLEAKVNRDILFFDEADSFLFPRVSAHHSWEKSFTNEVLSQLDNYTGIAFFATNDIDGLDPAALRRFKFKIEFQPLTAEGNVIFYKAMLMPFIGEMTDLPPEPTSQIKDLRNLTPGDFTVVKEQFLFTDKTGITHQRLIEALRTEAGYKKENRRITGFCRV